MQVEINRLVKEDVSDEELKMVKTRMRADLVRGLADNEGLASQLAVYQSLYGDWRELFRSVEKIDKVTPEDIQRIARLTFVPNNRTVAMIVSESPPRREEHPVPSSKVE